MRLPGKNKTRTRVMKKKKSATQTSATESSSFPPRARKRAGGVGWLRGGLLLGLLPIILIALSFFSTPEAQVRWYHEQPSSEVIAFLLSGLQPSLGGH